jgi:hypothetical protein
MKTHTIPQGNGSMDTNIVYRNTSLKELTGGDGSPTKIFLFFNGPLGSSQGLLI